MSTSSVQLEMNALYTYIYIYIENVNFEMYSFMNQVAVRAIVVKLWEMKDTSNTMVFA